MHFLYVMIPLEGGSFCVFFLRISFSCSFCVFGASRANATGCVFPSILPHKQVGCGVAGELLHWRPTPSNKYKETQQLIKTQFNPSQIKLSYRYWQNDETTVWILDELGKERDITTAIVIKNDKIAKVQVLIYRESRGGQVQNNRFTQQYNNKTSTNNFTKEIDSISGATLSVNALNKQVRMALWLNQSISKP